MFNLVDFNNVTFHANNPNWLKKKQHGFECTGPMSAFLVFYELLDRGRE